MSEQPKQPERIDDNDLVVWCAEDSCDERLDCYELGEAIHQALQAVHPDIPETLTMIGWCRMKAELPADLALEWAFNYLDQELADPDGDAPEPTPAMRAAAEAFCAVMVREYTPWACEEVCREVVDVKEWAKVNDQELLAEIEKREAE